MTGCRANYNLVVNNDYIDENLDIIIPNSMVDDEILNSQISNPISVYMSGNDKYKMTKKTDSSNNYINYSFKHKVSNFGNSNFMKKCFSNALVSDSEDSILINTGSQFNCIELEDDGYMDEVSINITTGLRVIKNNADKVSNNTYTWVFNDENYMDKSIEIEMKKNDEETLSIVVFIVLMVILGILSYLFYKFVKKKNDLSNQF